MRILSLPLQLYGLLYKDAMLLIKRKKQLIGFLLLPLLISAIFLSLIGSTGTDLSVGVCNADKGEFGESIVTELEREFATKRYSQPCGEKFEDAIESGEIDVGVKVEEDFTQKITKLQRGHLEIYADTTDIAFASLLSWRIDASISRYTDSLIEKQISELQSNVETVRKAARTVNLDSEELDFIEQADSDFIVRPVGTYITSTTKQVEAKHAAIVYVIPILAWIATLLLVSMGYIYDKKSGMLTRIKSSSSVVLYLLSKLIFYSLLTVLQVLFILLIFSIAGGEYPFSVNELLLLCAYIGSTTTLVGILIGTITKTEGAAFMVSILISFPMMLLSGAFLPLQTAPALLRGIVQVLPMHHHITATKAVLLTGGFVGFTWVWFILAGSVAVWYFIRRDQY